MLIDDTNYWKTEEKMFRELMPSDGLISSADEACDVVEAILSKRVFKKRKFWLLMFALTDRELMRPGPRKVFDCIMESKALTTSEKASICELVLKEIKPFKAEYVLPPDQLIAKYENIRARAIKGFEELKQKTYEEMIGDGPINIDKLVTDALGLPGTTIETYYLPYFRLFPTILPCYAVVWLCRLGKVQPVEMVVRYGLERTEGNGEERRPFFLGVMDLLQEFKDELEDNLIDKALQKGKKFPHIEVRKAVYRLGLELRGRSFLTCGLKDQSAAVRRTVQKLIDRHS